MDYHHPPSKLTQAHKEVKKEKIKEEGVLKKTPDPRIKEILDLISNTIGYPIPFYTKEAVAVKRALGLGYSPEQFLDCWQQLKSGRFWRTQWLPLTKVVENLGEFAQGKLRKGKLTTETRRLPTAEELHKSWKGEGGSHVG